MRLTPVTPRVMPLKADLRFSSASSKPPQNGILDEAALRRLMEEEGLPEPEIDKRIRDIRAGAELLGDLLEENGGQPMDLGELLEAIGIPTDDIVPSKRKH